MSEYDRYLTELATGIDGLSRPATASLFAACAMGLRPAFDEWATGHDRVADGRLLDMAIAAGSSFGRLGTIPVDADGLLAQMARGIPDYQGGDYDSPTAAQDCWICADVSVRVMVEPQYQAGPAIEYALEPAMQQATQRLFGVSDLGHAGEPHQLSAVFEDSDVVAARNFCMSAVRRLRTLPVVDEPTQAHLSAQASVLWPPPT